jgi:hypothetical protein
MQLQASETDINHQTRSPMKKKQSIIQDAPVMEEKSERMVLLCLVAFSKKAE